MVDEERLTRLADAVLRDVGRLKALAQTEDLLHQPDQLDAVKYRFVTAIEGCVSVAHHVVAAELGRSGLELGRRTPTGRTRCGGCQNRDTVANASGFRNLLVHRYDAIDDNAVIGFLNQVSVIEGFVSQLLGWLADQEPSSS